MIQFNGQNYSLEQFLAYLAQHPEDTAAYENAKAIYGDRLDKYINLYGAYSRAQDGSGSWNDVYGAISGAPGINVNGELEKFIDNQVSRENTQNAQAYDKMMRDTQVTSTANQLGSLGLSTSNVISSGFASNNAPGAAATSHMSASSLAQQKKINEYNQRLGMAKSVVGLVGQMASSGIYGGALNAAKHAGQALSAATAHSAQRVLASRITGKFKDSDLPPIPNNLPSSYDIFSQ